MSNRRKKDNSKSPPHARRERKVTAIDNRAPLTSGATQPPTSSDSPLRYYLREAGRPILNALRAAAEEALARLPGRLSEIKEEFQRLESEGKLTVDHAKELVAPVEEWHELTNWIHPNDAPLSDARKLEIAKFMVESGFTAEDASAVVRKTDYLSRGRPATCRSSTIRAAEMKALNPELTWKQITECLCPCKKGAHDFDCVRALCRDVTRLRAVLKKHGIRPLLSGNVR